METSSQGVASLSSAASRYAKPVELSKRVRFDIDRDVFRGRGFEFGTKFLPDSMSGVGALLFLTPAERRYLSQVEGRTYANMLGLVERFIGAKMLDVTRAHWLGDQRALEALVRFTDEELKHQEMFRRLERMAASGMPAGYQFVPDANAVASVVLAKSTWAVLALTCHIEVFVLAHYRQAIAPDPALSSLFRDVMLHHWREESQHVIVDEIEWEREDASLSASARQAAVDDLIALMSFVDGIAQVQARADAEFFSSTCGRELTAGEADRVGRTLTNAYRWQYILSGANEPRFMTALAAKITPSQMKRIETALAPLVTHARAA
jgi:hypothetical protein